MPAPRSLLLDGPPVARVGDAVHQVVAVDDEHALLLCHHQRGPHGGVSSRVWRWTLADGAVAMLADLPELATLLARGGRVFMGQCGRVRWQDLRGGRSGELDLDARGALACTPDGRHIVTCRDGPMRRVYSRISAVEGGPEFPEVDSPIGLADDGAHAIHHEDGTLVRTSLGDRGTARFALEPRDWRGFSAIRGTSRVLAWDADHLVVLDLAGLRVVASIPRPVREAIASAAHVLHLEQAPLARSVGLLCLADGTTRALGERSGERWDFTPDGRLLRARRVLDVIDPRTGDALALHRGHAGSVRRVEWSADGDALATADDDGELRIHRLRAPSAPITLRVPDSPRLAFLPDGRLCVQTRHELRIVDPARGDALARRGVDEHNTHTLAALPDGRRVLTARYNRGVRLLDLASGRTLAESAATRLCTAATVARDRIFTVAGERVPYSSIDARYVLSWVALDLDGDLLDRGEWIVDHAMDLQVSLDDGHALVQGVQRGRCFRLYDLADPRREPAAVALAGVVLDHRRGRVLVDEQPDLVLRDAAGRELARLTPTRAVLDARLGPAVDRVALVYRDMGVEVVALP